MSPAALPPGAVAVVRTTPDTTYARWTAGLGDPDAGVAAVAARPGLRHSGWLARDLLAALGKRFTVAASGRSADRDWQLVPIWYAAHGITDLIVAGCQQLPAAVVDDLICHTRPLPLRLWLLADNHLPQPLADALAVWPTTPLAQADFTAHWHHHPARHPDAEEDGGEERLAARLPASDFPTFRADCRRLLADEGFARVDARYRAAFARSQHGLADTDPGDAAAVAALARQLLDDCATTAEMTVALRALQAAAFLAGHHLQLDLPTLLAAGEHTPTAARRNPATWKRLRCYRQPLAGAACALAAAGCDLPQMHQLTVADVAADGTHVTVDRTPVAVEPAATPLLAAQRLQRLADGAAPDAPLLVDATADRLTPKRLADAINTAATEACVAVTHRHVRHRTPDPRSTLRQLGLTTQPLTAGETP